MTARTVDGGGGGAAAACESLQPLGFEGSHQICALCSRLGNRAGEETRACRGIWGSKGMYWR